jgi:hypothetical protein
MGKGSWCDQFVSNYGRFYDFLHEYSWNVVDSWSSTNQKRGIQFTNIYQSMLKLKAHSGFHDFFRFWYIWEYKYGSILWLEDGNLYLRLRKMSHIIYAVNGKVSPLDGIWTHTIDTHPSLSLMSSALDHSTTSAPYNQNSLLWFLWIHFNLQFLYKGCVSMVWVQIPSREEQKVDSSKI